MQNVLLKSIGFLINTGAIIAPKYTAKQGYKLFSRPQPLQLRDKHYNFFNSAENLNLDFNGEIIRVYKWGSGEKRILFCHGWQSHSYRWIPYVSKLADQGYTLYAMDGPASGQTTGKVLNMPLYEKYVSHVINHLGPFNYYVGHSLGAFSIIFSFYKNPNFTADGIVSLAAPGNAMDFVEEYLEMMGLTKKAYHLILNEFIKKFKINPEELVAAEFAKKIDVPGLIVHDKEDEATDYQYSVKLKENWGNAKLITVTGEGHKLRGKKVINHVCEFVGLEVASAQKE